MLDLHFRRGSRQGRWLLIGLLGLALAGCFGKADSDDPSGGLFPLQVGRQWSYQLITDMNDDLLSGKLSITVDRVVDLDGWETWVRRNSSGIEYYLRRDGQGIRRVATRTDLQEQPELDAKPRVVLKTPLRVGESWDAMTAPYLLRRSNEQPRDLIQTHQAMMTYKVESLNESVEVPAGSYQGCALIKGEAALRLFTDPNSGFTDVPLISREWYCPGVGLAKFEREEIVPPSAFMAGGKISYVLTTMN